MHVITYKFHCTCSLLYSKEKGFTVLGDGNDDDEDDKFEERLISSEDVEMSEYEKRREERIAAIKRKREEMFGTDQPATSITKKKKVHASKVCITLVL